MKLGFHYIFKSFLVISILSAVFWACSPRSNNDGNDQEDDYFMYFDAGPWVPPTPDVTPPVLTLLSPETTCLTDMTTFRFRVEDTESAIGFVSLRFAGTLQTLTELGNGEYEATMDVSTLFEGTHILLIKAFDLPNNEAVLEKVLGVSHGGGVLHEDVLLCEGPIDEPAPPIGGDAGPDVEPPELSFVGPAAGDLIGITPQIQVRAIDSSMPVELTLNIGGQDFSATSENAFYIFEPDLTGLSEGTVTMTLYATDALDNSSELSMDVSLDLTLPTIRIIKPNENDEQCTLEDVKACAKDANGISLVMLHEQGTTAALATNNSPLSSSIGCNSDEDEFGLFYDLRDTSPLPRNTTFTISAIDMAGNTKESQINLRLISCD